MTKDELYKMLSEIPSKKETKDEYIPVAKKDNGDGTVTLSTIMSVGKDDGGETESDKKDNGKSDEEAAAVAKDEGEPNAAVAEEEVGVDVDVGIDDAESEVLKGLDCETLADRRLATQVILSLYSSTETKANMLELLKSFWRRKDIDAMAGLGMVIADIKKKGSLGEDGFARVKEALKKVRDSLAGENADAIYKRCSDEVREKVGGLLTDELM